jgi:uncharacterized pyridoxamine 5'-phosphate oxidase family protein
MTIKQIQKIEEIVEKLDELKTYTCERLDLHNEWVGKSNVKRMFKNVNDMIDDLYDIDTKDIMDMGLNELSIPYDGE